MADELDNSDTLFNAMNALCAGYPSAHVVYALGMMVAKAVRDNSSTADLPTTLELVRAAAELELLRMGQEEKDGK